MPNKKINKKRGKRMKNEILRRSCSKMRIFSWSRTVLRMRSLPADIFRRSPMVNDLSLTIKCRSKIELAFERDFFQFCLYTEKSQQSSTHVIRKFRHEKLLVDRRKFVFQASPSLVTGHKVCVSGGLAVQLLVKSIARSKPE